MCNVSADLFVWYVLGDGSNIRKSYKQLWDIREDSCTLAASVFSKNTKGRFLSSKACAYWKFILAIDKHPLALNEIISWLWSTADDQISEKEHETFDVHTKHWQYLAVRVCVRALMCVFVVYLLYFQRELQYDSDRLWPASDLHLWLMSAGLKPRHNISDILNIDEAEHNQRRRQHSQECLRWEVWARQLHAGQHNSSVSFVTAWLNTTCLFYSSPPEDRQSDVRCRFPSILSGERAKCKPWG